MIVTLPTMDAFGTGFQIGREEKYAMRDHSDWYNSDFRSLLPPRDSLARGRLLLPDQSDVINLPLFRLASDFLGNAVIGELPAHSPNSQAQEAWVERHESIIMRALRRATVYWSIHDYTVFTSERGFIRAYDPQYYWRVGDPAQRDELVGHILAHPYREVRIDEVNANVHHLERVPDRIQVLKVYPENPDSENPTMPSTVEIYELSGRDGVVGRRLSGPSMSSVTAACVAGDGDSFYPGSKDLAAQIILDFSNIEQDLNRDRNMIELFPAEVADAIKRAAPRSQRSDDLRGLREYLYTQRFPAASFDPERGMPQPRKESIRLDSAFEMLRSSLDLFFMASGVPPSSFGIGVGRGESGFAREKAQDAASARARAYRRDLADCLPILCAKAGAPPNGGMIGWTWASPPFQDRAARQAELIALHSAGIITTDEVRLALGWKGSIADAPDSQSEMNSEQESENQEE